MLQPQVSLVEVFVRVVLIYVVLLVLIRITGKREVGQLTPMSFLSMLILSETVSPALTGQDRSLTASFVAAAGLLALSALVEYLGYRFPRLERLLEGSPVILIRDGVLRREAMKKQRLTEQQVFTELRKAGVDSLAGVAKATVEPSGRITVIRS